MKRFFENFVYESRRLEIFWQHDDHVSEDKRRLPCKRHSYAAAKDSGPRDRTKFPRATDSRTRHEGNEVLNIKENVFPPTIILHEEI